MKILVLIKEVPDMEKVRFDSERGGVDRAKAPAEINPFDENALQIAIELKKKFADCEVTALTMGPPRAEESLKMAYARGADRCVLLTDRAVGGSDTKATASALSSVIRKLGGFDLIVCGEKSVDGDTAQVGAEVAEMLDIPHCYYAEKILDIADDHIDVRIAELWGKYQNRRLRFPALVGVTKNIIKPKLPTVKRRLESLTVEVEKLGLADLEGFVTAEEVGFKGSPTRVAKVVVPPEQKRSTELFRGDDKAFMDKFREVLREELGR